jgi:hypothetical protein
MTAAEYLRFIGVQMKMETVSCDELHQVSCVQDKTE